MRQHRFQGLEEIATCACLTSTKPKTLHLKACCLGPRSIEIVGAFYNGDWKPWAHFIAGLCLQLWPQHELKPWAHVTEDNWNRGRILQPGNACSLGRSTNWNRGRILNWGFKIGGPFDSGAMRVALATARIEIVGAFYNRDLKSWAHFIAGLCLQPWPQKELKSWAHVTEDNWNRGHIL